MQPLQQHQLQSGRWQAEQIELKSVSRVKDREEMGDVTVLGCVVVVTQAGPVGFARL